MKNFKNILYKQKQHNKINEKGNNILAINLDKNISSLLLNQNITLSKLNSHLNETDFSLNNLKDSSNTVFENLNEEIQALENVLIELSNYSSTTQEVLASTEESKTIAEMTYTKARLGNDDVQKTISSMNDIEAAVNSAKDIINELNNKSIEINSIVGMIKKITKQTKLLSLNASIEASKAGDAGRGFSVVAQEINKLALTSNESAENIAHIILSMDDIISNSKKAMELCLVKVAEGNTISNNTLSTFNDIIDSVKETTSVSNNINSAMNNQTESLTSILDSTESLRILSNKIVFLIEWVQLNTQYTKTALNSIKELYGNLKSINEKINEKVKPKKENPIVLNADLGGVVFSFDPVLGLDNISCEVISIINSSLLKINKDGELLPSIAKSWTLSEDALTWTFSLIKGAKFHDLTEVTAQDVKFSLERVLSPKSDCSNNYFLEDIAGANSFMKGDALDVTGIKVINNYCISLTLNEPYSGILTNISHSCCSVISKNAYLNNRKIVSCGAFLCDNPDPKSRSLKLTAFQEHFNGAPYIDELNISSNLSNLKERILNKEIELLKSSTADSFNKLKDEKSIKFRKAPTLCSYYGYIPLNTNKPWAQNVEVRKALNMAIDRETIVKDVFSGSAIPLNGPCPIGLISKTPKAISYNLKEAKAIFQKHNVLSKEKNFRMASYNNDTALYSQLTSNLEALGLKVTFTSISFNDFFDKEISKQYDLLLTSWFADTLNPDSFLIPLFMTDVDYNLSNYSNLNMEELLKKAKTIINPKDRDEAFQEVEQIIADDFPWLFIACPALNYTYQEYVNGVTLNPLGIIGFENIMINK